MTKAKRNPHVRLVKDNTRSEDGSPRKPIRLFTFFTDGRLGYLYVPFKDIEDMGLSPFTFTASSRIDSKGMYLEEEMDAQIFTEVYEQKGGFRVVLNEIYEESLTLRQKQNNTVSAVERYWKERQIPNRLRVVR